jgi:hypothetical protein
MFQLHEYFKYLFLSLFSFQVHLNVQQLMLALASLVILELLFFYFIHAYIFEII